MVQALFQYPVNVDYLAGNPWNAVKALTQDRVKGPDHQDIEVHDRELPIVVIHAIEDFVNGGPGLPRDRRRNVCPMALVWTFFLYIGARMSSGCPDTVVGIYLDRRGHHQLTPTVKGAGLWRENVPWIPALARVYQHYRQVMGLLQMELNTRLTRREVTDPLPLGKGPGICSYRCNGPQATARPCPTRPCANRCVKSLRVRQA
jgi:hypothetical protein